MTKAIVILMIVMGLYGGWELFLYWDRVKNEEATAKKQAASAVVVGEQLPGMPQQLETSLQAAQKLGATGLRNWLKTYGPSIQDPRKAWIELDYCVALARSDPNEAKRVFAGVKKRLQPSSPLWPRIKQLESTYE